MCALILSLLLQQQRPVGKTHHMIQPHHGNICCHTQDHIAGQHLRYCNICLIIVILTDSIFTNLLLTITITSIAMVRLSLAKFGDILLFDCIVR